MVLSGTFGELRPNHFHAGLDLKTEQREGLDVFATADGYVSRIKISHWGYGKAIYVTHPNGFTSVYAHLQKFNKRIEDYIRKEQYKIESFEIHVFPNPTDLPVSKNEIIAFSGSTGGFVGPHLHFEIRDTKTEKPVNPMLFGIDIADTKIPKITSLMGYSLEEESHINKVNMPIKLSFKRLNNGDLLADEVEAYGTIGFGISAYDQQDGAYNKNGLYSLELIVNGEKLNSFKANSFAFNEGKYINLLIDYEYYELHHDRIQKSFIDPVYELSLFENNNLKGRIQIKDGLNYTVKLIATDFKGNKQQITIPIKGKKSAFIKKETPAITPYKINAIEFNKFEKNGVTVAFPKNTFYKDFYLDFEVENEVAKVHKPVVPLDRNYTLTFDVSNLSELQKKHLFIASINKNGNVSYENTIIKETTCYTTTKKLGNFKLAFDEVPPTIRLDNFNNKQWMSNYNFLKVKIKDNESGINSYRGEIDGEWILMEYDVKNGTLTYDFNDKSFSKAKHQLKITVTDNVGNSSTLNAVFFRKK